MRWIVTIAISAVEWLLCAWVLMVGVDLVNAGWFPQLPTIGFGFSALLTGLLIGANAVRVILAAIVSGLVGDE